MVQASFIVPHGADSRSYICIPVDESIATRSAVMATLMQFEGVVELPVDLKASDLLTWADLQPERAESMSVDELTFALKIGDQVGDQECTAFATAMSEKISYAKLSDKISFEHLQTMLLSLNANLQARVLLGVPEHDRVWPACEQWPLAMQLALCDALVHSGSCAIPKFRVTNRSLESALSMLSRTTPATGLRAMSIEAPVSSSAASVLQHALLHHANSLDSLKLWKLQEGAEATTLATIGRLSHLTSLTLHLFSAVPKHCQTSPHIVSDLARSISLLPGLAEFDFQPMMISSDDPKALPPHKRRKIDAAGNSPHTMSFDPVVAALSTAPCLMSLHLRFHFSAQGVAIIPCSGIQGPFVALQQLTIACTESSPKDAINCMAFASRGFVWPSARLPALSRLHFTCQGCRNIIDAAEVIFKGMALQDSLCSAKIEAPSSSLSGRVAGAFKRPGTLACLKTLEVGNLKHMESNPEALLAVVMAIGCISALTSLQVTLPDISECNNSDWTAETVHDKLLAPLSHLGNLKDLHCRCVTEYEDDTELVPAAVSLVRQALPSLTQLTRLHIARERIQHRGGCQIASIRMDPENFSGFHAMQELRHLDMDLIGLCFSHTEQVRQWLEGMHLRHITHMALTFEPFTEATVRSVVLSLQRAPEMRFVHVETSCADQYNSRLPDLGWTQGLIDMPVSGQISIYCLEDMAEEGVNEGREEEVDAVVTALTERGSEVTLDLGHGCEFSISVPISVSTEPDAQASEHMVH